MGGSFISPVFWHSYPKQFGNCIVVSYAVWNITVQIRKSYVKSLSISVKPLDSEVSRLLEAAKRMKENKKIERADKLYSQALRFAPNHPEILSMYDKI